MIYKVLIKLIEKIYKYTKEEEAEIDRKFGYTPEQQGGLSHEHYQYSIGLSDIAGFFFWSFNRKCPNCGKARLDWKMNSFISGFGDPATRRAVRI